MSVGTELITEIARVSRKIGRWEQYARTIGPPANFQPAIMLMRKSVNQAKEALVGDDPVAAIRAFEDLKSFNDDD